jgi:exocyst complex component 4
VPADPWNKASHLSSYLHELNLKQNDSPHDPSANTRVSLATITSIDLSTPQTNPESDSFTYLETILESLAILGKLGSGLESITQRLPMELYSIVETTIDEVNERSEFSKRLPGFMNNAANIVAAKTATAYMYVDPKRSAGSAPAPDGTTTTGVSATDKPAASLLRFSALENSATNPDHEILRDLFWTLYSKLDAVSQSMRVVYEVANRIGSVSDISHQLACSSLTISWQRKDFRDSLGAKSGAIFPFPELWEPLDAEVSGKFQTRIVYSPFMQLRGLIMLYLTVETGGASTGKTQIPSINEVLQTGKVTRDKGWVSLFTSMAVST